MRNFLASLLRMVGLTGLARRVQPQEGGPSRPVPPA